MNTDRIAATAQQLIEGFDTQAHRAIAAWREGGDRLGQAARERWDSAFAESRSKLAPETRANATKARDAFAGCYAKGVDLSATGAGTAVDVLVRSARVAVDRASAWQQSRA